jgi:drug/metabolite transporter (DMT)-like permease
MGAGAAALTIIAWRTGGFAAAGGFGLPQWATVVYLGLFGGALVFYLWAFALARTTPTRVASTITVNPITASAVAALLLGEPVGLHLVVGIAAVGAGIWLASTSR